MMTQTMTEIILAYQFPGFTVHLDVAIKTPIITGRMNYAIVFPDYSVWRNACMGNNAAGSERKHQCF